MHMISFDLINNLVKLVEPHSEKIETQRRYIGCLEFKSWGVGNVFNPNK